MAKSTIDVLVFDSGVGGLSVLEAIRKSAPRLSYAFLGDNAGLPYGDKAESWLVERVPRVIAKAMKDFDFDCQALVVACNTASTIVLPPLRNRFSCPVIGVVPAIKPAAALSRKKIIGLLATPATIARPYTDALIAEFASECEVVRIGSSRLVAIAEEKMRGGSVDREELKAILKDFERKKPDIVVLGCTHFPLLRAELEALMPDVQWIDSGEAIAKRVLHFGLQPSSPAVREGKAYFTKNDITADELSGFGLKTIHFLPL